MIKIAAICLRVLIGLLFIFSSWEKIIGPYQNFLYVIETYDVIGPPFDQWVARTLPWIELLVGLFLLLGLWVKWSLRVCLAMFIIFMVVVTQAIIRKLPITECGCFGEGISLPLSVILIFDSVLFLISAVLLKNSHLTGQWGMDQYFSSNDQ